MWGEIQSTHFERALWDWLDTVISELGCLSVLDWPGQTEISLAESLRASLYIVIRDRFEGSAEHQKRAPSRATKQYVLQSRVKRALKHLGPRLAYAPKTPREIVFLPVTKAHFNQQMPVALKLAQLGRSLTFVTDNAWIANNVRAAGLDCVGAPLPWREQAVIARLLAWQLSLRLQAEKKPKLSPFRLKDHVFDLDDWVYEIIAKSALIAYGAYVNARNVVEILSPRLVVLGNDLTPDGRVMAHVARYEGIQSVTLMHGALDGQLDAGHVADKMLVFGNFARRALLALGLDQRRVKTCGAPNVLQEWLQLDMFAKPASLSSHGEHARIFSESSQLLQQGKQLPQVSQRLVEDYFFQHDGSASERVAHALIEECRRS